MFVVTKLWKQLKCNQWEVVKLVLMPQDMGDYGKERKAGQLPVLTYRHLQGTSAGKKTTAVAESHGCFKRKTDQVPSSVSMYECVCNMQTLHSWKRLALGRGGRWREGEGLSLGG